MNVNGGTLKTFDGLTVGTRSLHRTLQSGCQVVLSQDCSNSGLFSIVTSGSTDLSWMIRVLVLEHEVQWTRGNDGFGNVIIDGQLNQLNVSHPIVVHENSDDIR